MTTTTKLNLNLMTCRVDSRSSKLDIVAQIVRLVRVLDAGELAGSLDAGQLGAVSLLRSFTHGKFVAQDVRGYVSDFELEARDAFVAIAGARSTAKATWRTIFDAIKATAKDVAQARRDARQAKRIADRSPQQITDDARRSVEVAGKRSSSATDRVAALRAELVEAVEAEGKALERHAVKVEALDAAELAQALAVMNPDGMPETNIDLPKPASSTRQADEAKADAANACGTEAAPGTSGQEPAHQVVLDTATDTTRASLCCGFAIRRFGNGAELCESCGRRCEHEAAPEGGAPAIDELEAQAVERGPIAFAVPVEAIDPLEALELATDSLEVGTFPATFDGIKAAASAAVEAIAASKLAKANAATGAGRREAAGVRVVWKNLPSSDVRKEAAKAVLRSAAGMAPGVGKVTRVAIAKAGDTVRGDVLRKRPGLRTWENLGTFLADLPERFAFTS